VVLYGSETWVLSVREGQRLESFQMRCLRTIVGVTKWITKRTSTCRKRPNNAMLENS